MLSFSERRAPSPEGTTIKHPAAPKQIRRHHNMTSSGPFTLARGGKVLDVMREADREGYWLERVHPDSKHGLPQGPHTDLIFRNSTGDVVKVRKGP